MAISNYQALDLLRWLTEKENIIIRPAKASCSYDLLYKDETRRFSDNDNEPARHFSW